jgi:hypothetical protein
LTSLGFGPPLARSCEGQGLIGSCRKAVCYQSLTFLPRPRLCGLSPFPNICRLEAIAGSTSKSGDGAQVTLLKVKSRQMRSESATWKRCRRCFARFEFQTMPPWPSFLQLGFQIHRFSVLSIHVPKVNLTSIFLKYLPLLLPSRFQSVSTRCRIDLVQKTLLDWDFEMQLFDACSVVGGRWMSSSPDALV